MKKNTTKTTKKTNPAKAVKTASKKTAKQIPWEERRNEVLSKARAKLRETIAAGKDALENVNEASKAKDDILPEYLVNCMIVRAKLHNDWAFVAPTGYILVFNDDNNAKCIPADANIPDGYFKHKSKYVNLGGETMDKRRYEAARKMFFGK